MQAGFLIKLGFLLGGLIIWAAHFLFVYGFNGIVCARGLSSATLWGIGTVPLTVAVATVFAAVGILAITALAVAGRGPGIAAEADASLREFWRFTTAATGGLSLVSVLWTAVPVLFISPCP